MVRSDNGQKMEKKIFEENVVKVEGSRSEGAEVAGSKVTMDKIYAKKLFEEKVVKGEGSRSEDAEVTGYEVTMETKWEDIF